MASSYELNQEVLAGQIADRYIANLDGTQEPAKGLNSPGAELLKTLVINQMGTSAAELFYDNFINYTSGYILCVNTKTFLNSFTIITPRSISASLVFTLVTMPGQFIGQQANLSSKYEYGEVLKIAFSFESTNLISQIPNGLSLGSNYNSVVSNKLVSVARDMNVKGRSLKSQAASTGGIGIGVWS
jgi:hypothetical protein